MYFGRKSLQPLSQNLPRFTQACANYTQNITQVYLCITQVNLTPATSTDQKMRCKLNLQALCEVSITTYGNLGCKAKKLFSILSAYWVTDASCLFHRFRKSKFYICKIALHTTFHCRGFCARIFLLMYSDKKRKPVYIIEMENCFSVN